MQIPEAKPISSEEQSYFTCWVGGLFIRGGTAELIQQTKSKYTAVMLLFPLLLQLILFPGIFCFLNFSGKRITVSNVPHQVSPVKL